MNNSVFISSAYRQLLPAEKMFVDKYVQALQAIADRRQVRLHVVLSEPVQMDNQGMLNRPLVTAAITERINELAITEELSPDRVIREWTAIAFSNLTDLVEFDEFHSPTLTVANATPEQQVAVKKLTFDRAANGAVRLNIEMHDKLAALSKLSGYLGIDVPENDHWRSRNAKTVIESSAAVRDAADAYGRLLEADD